MTNIKRIIIFISVIFIILLFFMNNVYGFGINDLTGTEHEVATLKSTGNSIVKVISTIGVVISVVMLIILGIKYMMGSVEEKAEYKKTMIPYIIGVVFIVAISTILPIIAKIVESLNK